MKGMTLDSRAVGQRIRERRKELGLSQRAVTNDSSISYAYLSRIEAGLRTPALSVLIELAEKLDTTAHHLAFGHTHGNCPFCGRIAF